MSFDTLTFWIFFLVAWSMWRLLPFAAAKSAALVLSLLFYAWWNPWYLPLIAVSAGVDYIVGDRIHRSQNGNARFAWLLTSLICNLGLLAFFKYGPFAVRNAASFAQLLGFHIEAPLMRDWVVPVGISFYTFQTLSYSLDIYRRRLQPAASFRDFFLFVACFPQLVAGPIVRAGQFLPQLSRRRALTALALQKGIYCIIWGLFMKVVVADNLALPVDSVFTMKALSAASPATVWLSAIYFSVQIFADFAGYSSIAIGLAYLMGLRFPENFRYPYISCSLREFWTRWHITLSEWLRDYLYIPLGGNRKGPRRMVACLMATMLLGGLWHGASWTFVAWGALHAAGLVLERALTGQFSGRKRGSTSGSSAGRLLWRVITTLTVLVFLVITWVFFRAESFEMAWLALYKMLLAPFYEPFAGLVLNRRFILLLFPVIGLHLGQLAKERLGLRQNSYVRAMTAAVMLFLLIVISRPGRHVFIYFQF